MNISVSLQPGDHLPNRQWWCSDLNSESLPQQQKLIGFGK